MRAIDCPCGHHFEATDDEELFRLCREHVDSEHPEMQRSDERLHGRIAADAYEAATVDARRGRVDAGEPHHPGLLPDRRAAPTARRRAAVLHGPVPEPRRRRARAAVCGHRLRAVRDRARREFRCSSSVRPPLESRGAPPCGRPGAAAQPAAPPRRVQGRDGLAGACRGAVRRRCEHGRARARRVARRRMRRVATAANLCLPSEMFAWLERRRTPAKPITT